MSQALDLNTPACFKAANHKRSFMDLQRRGRGGGTRSIICPSPPWILNDSSVIVKEAFHRPCCGKAWALGRFELRLHSLGVILHIRKQLLFWRECSCVFLRLSWACSVCISWWCAAENAATGNRNSLFFMSFLHRPVHWCTRLCFCGWTTASENNYDIIHNQDTRH